MKLARLAPEPESNRRPRHACVTVAHRRQAVGPVVASVLLVPHAYERLLEQLNDRRHDLATRQRRARQVGGGAPTQAWESGRELEDAAELCTIADLAPARVITILLAAPRVATGRLQVAARIRADLQ